MPVPEKDERIRRKRVMLAAGINVPNTDESWGPWWDELWKNAITHTKTDENYYGIPSVGHFIQKVFDDITGNTTFEAEPLPIGGTLQAVDNSIGAQVKRTLNNWWYFGDPIRDITLFMMPDPSKPVKAGKLVAKATPLLIKAVPKLFTKAGAKKAGARVAKTVIKEVPKAGAGYLGGKTVDKVSEATTGKSWAENASDKMSDIAGFHIEPIFGELINPGYSGGYYIGNKVYNPIYEQTILPRVEGIIDYLNYLRNIGKNNIEQSATKFAKKHDYIGSGYSDDKTIFQKGYDNPFNIEDGITITKYNDGRTYLGNLSDYAIFELRPNSDMVAIPHLGNYAPDKIARVMPRDRIALAGAFERSFPKGTYIGDGPYVPWAQTIRNNGWKSLFRKRLPLLTGNGLIEMHPYSYDSYKLLLQRGSKPGYELRYTGDMFIPNNHALKNIVDETLPIEVQLNKVNELIRQANPNAKLAKIIDGQIQLPHAWLVKTR